MPSYRDTLTAEELALASVACERAALLPGAAYMTEIAEKLRAEGDRRAQEGGRDRDVPTERVSGGQATADAVGRSRPSDY